MGAIAVFLRIKDSKVKFKELGSTQAPGSLRGNEVSAKLFWCQWGWKPYH